MKPTATMTRLIWKDAITIRPLMIAVVAGMLAFNLPAIAFNYVNWPGRWQVDLFMGLWILMPNLFAIGAPAMLVGTEEDSGTLNWLRTLPIAWQRVLRSKWIVGLLGLLLCWLFSSVVFSVILAWGTFESSAGFDEIGTLPGILFQLFFSVLLLLCGFVTAYFVRSPVAALLLMVPLIVALSFAATITGSILVNAIRYYELDVHWFNGIKLWSLIGVGIGYLAVVWVVGRWLGKRRMVGAERTFSLRLSNDFVRPYQPPRGLPGAESKPSRTKALLWQQWRQMAPVAIPLFSIALVSLLLFKLVPTRIHGTQGWLSGMAEFAPLFLSLAVIWLGGATFYGDAVRRRCAYFADRGISPTAVWWTRLAVPALFCLVVGGLMLIPSSSAAQQSDRSNDFQGSLLFAAALAGIFVVSQFASQITHRPVLGFLVAPVAVVLYYMFVAMTAVVYDLYAGAMALALPVLLFATWRMTPRWLEGRFGTGFYARAFGYAALALVLPWTLILASRVITTPAFDGEWRTAMFHKSEARLSVVEQNLEEHPPMEIDSQAYDYGLGQYPFTDLTDIKKRLEQELADEEGIGRHVSFPQLEFVARNLVDLQQNEGLSREESDDVQRMAMKTLAKWARASRELVLRYSVSSAVVSQIAEPAERLLVEQFHDGLGTPEQLGEIVAMIPDAELRKKSRELKLIQEWQAYQVAPWYRDPSGYQKSFLGQPVGVGVAWLPLERRRSDRFLDQAVKVTLDGLKNGLPAKASVAYERRRALWGQMVGPRWRKGGLTQVFSRFLDRWTLDHEMAIADLRARYPAN
ncbi:ABC transporter permease [Novipirellula artificiosorum]|uniref:ABC-2 family transporter protein n=1 Tax=Novipirellula artificiosorum TaxID=2528016 RepID=A0A5C6DKK4_9BACT|nr:ABC transporter permease [Novipirellula artificiosorum]TWU37298.1 ABC-2 family transporter protein [Novipirellula artificiosorum]